MRLYQEKADQAAALLDELDLDCWLTFARETGERPDPGVELLLGAGLTWNAALIFGRGGARSAIVGRYDTESVRSFGVFPEVIGYDEDMRAALLAALDRIDPRQIGLNYSLHDHTADGLTFYGDSPEGVIEAGHVYTLELAVPTPAGHLALEEDVLVTAQGCRFLSSFQRELMLI